MLYDLSRDLEVNMQARKFPVEFEYGPERLARLPNGAPLIVVMRDEEGDGLTPVRGIKVNPRRLMTREINGIVLFFVQATVEGARREEHEALCDQIVDGFLCELSKWQTGGRAGPVSVRRSRYVPKAALPLEWLEQWPGVVYEVALTLSRGVYDVTFEGEARPTAGTLAGARNRTEVTLRGAEESPPEVGCDNLPP